MSMGVPWLIINTFSPIYYSCSFSHVLALSSDRVKPPWRRCRRDIVVRTHFTSLAETRRHSWILSCLDRNCRYIFFGAIIILSPHSPGTERGWYQGCFVYDSLSTINNNITPTDEHYIMFFSHRTHMRHEIFLFGPDEKWKRLFFVNI